MEFIPMDKKSMPFSQGFVVQMVLGVIGGSLIASGYLPMSIGTAIYVKSTKGGRVAESVWIDDGHETAKCKYLNLGKGWTEKAGGKWIPAPWYSASLAQRETSA